MVHPLLQTLFAHLDEHAIIWCLLPVTSGPDRRGDQAQLLIDRHAAERVRHICEAHGFMALPGRPAVLGQRFLSYHEQTERCVELHVVHELFFGPYACFRTGAAASSLQRRQQQDSVWRLAPADAFWALLFHALLDTATIEPHDREALQRLAPAARDAGPLAQIIERFDTRPGQTARIIDDVRRGDWSALERYGAHLATAWRRNDPGGVRRSMRRHRLAARAAILRDLRRRHGLSVAVLGPDGAGKSTVAEGIAQAFCLPVRSVYMGLWQRRATIGRSRRVPGARLARLGMLVASRPFFIWSRYLLAQYHQTMGRLVIFDRYVYDSLLPPRPPFAAVKKPIFWLLAHLCPPPDLVFLLDAPGHLMAERKAEYSAEHLEAERQRFLSLRAQIPKLQVIDASRDLDAVRREVLGRIWRGYVARWRPRRALAVATTGEPQRRRRTHDATDA